MGASGDTPVLRVTAEDAPASVPRGARHCPGTVSFGRWSSESMVWMGKPKHRWPVFRVGGEGTAGLRVTPGLGWGLSGTGVERLKGG